MFAPKATRLAAVSGAAVATLWATSTATARDGFACTCDGGGDYVAYRSGDYEPYDVAYPPSRSYPSYGYAPAYGGAYVTYDYAPVRHRRVVHVRRHHRPRHYYRGAQYNYRSHRRHAVRHDYRPYRRHAVRQHYRPHDRHRGFNAGVRIGSRHHKRHYGFSAGIRIGNRPQHRHHGHRSGFRMRHRR